MELGLFDEVGEAVRGLMDPKLGVVHFRAHRYGVKLWFDTDSAPREHYEAQVIGARLVEDAKVLALEVGFHSEHPKLTENEATLAKLVAHERTWRKTIGKDAVVGPFLGRPDAWMRLSETWPDPDLSDDDMVMDVALRLNDYMTALEPLLRSKGGRR